GTLTVGAAGGHGLALGGNLQTNLDTRTLILVSGSTNTMSGSVFLRQENGALITNNGSFTVSGSNNQLSHVVGAAGTFNNVGTFTMAGTNTMSVSGAFNNTG